MIRYFGGVSEKIQRAAWQFGLKTFFSSGANIQQFLGSVKDPLNPTKCRSVVHAIPCECHQMYIGGNGMSDETRIQEHAAMLYSNQDCALSGLMMSIWACRNVARKSLEFQWVYSELAENSPSFCQDLMRNCSNTSCQMTLFLRLTLCVEGAAGQRETARQGGRATWNGAAGRQGGMKRRGRAAGRRCIENHSEWFSWCYSWSKGWNLTCSRS